MFWESPLDIILNIIFINEFYSLIDILKKQRMTSGVGMFVYKKTITTMFPLCFVQHVDCSCIYTYSFQSKYDNTHCVGHTIYTHVVLFSLSRILLQKWHRHTHKRYQKTNPRPPNRIYCVRARRTPIIVQSRRPFMVAERGAPNTTNIYIRHSNSAPNCISSLGSNAHVHHAICGAYMSTYIAKSHHIYICGLY